MTKNKFYITTAIFYTNAKPHIGHTLDLVQADVLARYHRLRGDDVFLLTGTDEHGTKIVRSARENKKAVQEWVDENAEAFKRVVEKLNISYDGFIRTSDQDKHWPAAQEVWRRLERSGDIYKKKYRGLYCVGHEAFLTEKELVDDICPDHGTKPEIVEEENYFFRLSKYQKELEKIISSDRYEVVPAYRKKEILNFIRGGLEDVSFSRPRESLGDWGIPVPGEAGQLMYVWADALTNYLSGVDYFSAGEKKSYWPVDVHVIGKDILRFHAAIWPAMLLSAGIDLPKKLLAHGFITWDSQKISKTVGNVVDPLEYLEEFGTDAVRYYLLAEIPTTEDSDFSRERFVERYNADLANGLGNLAARILTLAAGKEFSGTPDGELTDEIKKVWQNYEAAFGEFDLKKAVETAWALTRRLDQYIEQTKPWASKDGKILHALLVGLANVAWLIRPFLPETSDKIFAGLGTTPDSAEWNFEPKKIEILFPKIDV